MTTTYIPNQAPKLAISKFQALLAAGAIAVSAVAVTAWPSNPAVSDVDPVGASVDQTLMVDWAVENGLSGLSPASIGRLAAQPSIHDYATANGLSGLSAASLAPTD